jgi:TolA-binding protein
VTTPQHESIYDVLTELQAGQRRADLGIAMLADQIDELDGKVSEILTLLRDQQMLADQQMLRDQQMLADQQPFRAAQPFAGEQALGGEQAS